MKTLRSPLKFIRDCKLSRLRIWEDNPRINDPAVQAVSKSIAAFGFISPIIVDKDYRICAGHTRYKAATHLGLETVPVIMVQNLEGTSFSGFSIADNQTARLAEWDQDGLAKIVKELQQADFDLTSLGFSDEQLKDLLANMESGDFDPATLNEQGRLDRRTPVTCPKCGHEFEVGG